MSAREIILRRRARFVASAVGLSLGTVASTRLAGAQEIDRFDGGDIVGMDTPQTQLEQERALKDNHRVAVARYGCTMELDVSPRDLVQKVHDILAGARALYANKDEVGALAAIHSARAIAHIPKVEELEAEIHLAAGRLAQARAALEALESCDDRSSAGRKKPLSSAISFELESVRARTAKVTLSSPSVGHVIVDGTSLRVTNATLYIEAGGSHTIAIEDELNEMQERIFAFGGGEEERITIDGLSRGDGQPRVCLSVIRSWDDRGVRHEPFGFSLGAQNGINVAGAGGEQSSSDTNPMTWGARIAAFVRHGTRAGVEARGGLSAAPSASSKGFVMPTGAFVSAHIFAPSNFALGVGASSGYLISPDPSRTVIDNFEPRPSFFFEPHLPVSFEVGPFELETRLGLMWSQQEDAVRSRFALSYVTASVGLTWVPRRSF